MVMAPLDENVSAARAAGLVYVYDHQPGIQRVRAGKGFSYRDGDGRPIRDPEVLARIRSIAVPPAWTKVWICSSERGHIQATGRDAKGRKQYRYHARWRSVRDETKFDRLGSFARALPRVRRRVRADLRRQGFARDKVVAAAVALLDGTFARVGNEAYARDNGSFGITTLRDRHVTVRGNTIRIYFKGKAGRTHELRFDDARLAKIVRRCQDLPGQQLFQYVDDDGETRGLGSEDVNTYLREVTGGDYTAKDFRTWAGTVLFARALREVGSEGSLRIRKRKLTEAFEAVAALLGNTASVCRASYVHPGLVDRYLDGSYDELWTSCAGARKAGLRQDEAIVAAMLRRINGSSSGTSRKLKRAA